jgi:hypothetical protein
MQAADRFETFTRTYATTSCLNMEGGYDAVNCSINYLQRYGGDRAAREEQYIEVSACECVAVSIETICNYLPSVNLDSAATLRGS